ncbi:hypothetical protein GJ697_23540 [Pseudoduganella sp. FT25W]|uniref:Uncharacterized protein n=1 Tax=Duganella alba TaxID=2666081 RepID=A0A6L5QMB4_9BURK|nr:GH25 family lysozyme [Duganella alba]MRX10807.1 hypothetical protein [Duganella alba]MRX18926.1 hypothetical protein [Duganella alba]
MQKKEVRFAYLKATQGTGYMDGKFAMFWNQLGKLPKNQQVHRGAYHFLSAEKDGAVMLKRSVRQSWNDRSRASDRGDRR